MLNVKKKVIILAMAEFSMNESEAARHLGVHRNTVVYQCEQIFKKTGLNPNNFYDLVKLVDMVKEAE